MTDSRGFWDVVLLEGTDLEGWPAATMWVGLISFVISVIYFGTSPEEMVTTMLITIGSCAGVTIIFILDMVVMEISK
jgi:hypothetical protein